MVASLFCLCLLRKYFCLHKKKFIIFELLPVLELNSKKDMYDEVNLSNARGPRSTPMQHHFYELNDKKDLDINVNTACFLFSILTVQILEQISWK